VVTKKPIKQCKAELADPEWYHTTVNLVNHLAAQKIGFTTDDVFEVVGHPKGCDARAIGQVMSRMKADKKIKSAGFKRSARKSRHNGFVRVWWGAGK